jgi:copper chaperone CopZ
MQKIYELTGMSCGGCVNTAKQALLKLLDVTEAEVQLNPQKAVLTINKPVNVAELHDWHWLSTPAYIKYRIYIPIHYSAGY